jgi:hypothetical protein
LTLLTLEDNRPADDGFFPYASVEHPGPKRFHSAYTILQ